MKQTNSPSVRFHKGDSQSGPSSAVSLESRGTIADSDTRDMPPKSSVQLGQSTPTFLAQLPGEDVGQFLVRQYENIAKWSLRRAKYRGAEDPGDLLHDVMLKKLRNTTLHASGIQFLPKEFKKCAKNRYRSQQRRGKRQTPLTVEMEESIGVEDQHERMTDCEKEVSLLLPTLRPLDRTALVFIYLNGGSRKALAAHLGKSPGAIKSLLFQARRRAKKAMLRLRKLASDATAQQLR